MHIRKLYQGRTSERAVRLKHQNMKSPNITRVFALKMNYYNIKTKTSKFCLNHSGHFQPPICLNRAAESNNKQFGGGQLDQFIPFLSLWNSIWKYKKNKKAKAILWDDYCFYHFLFIIVFVSFCTLLNLQTGFLLLEAQANRKQHNQWCQCMIACALLGMWLFSLALQGEQPLWVQQISFFIHGEVRDRLFWNWRAPANFVFSLRQQIVCWNSKLFYLLSNLTFNTIARTTVAVHYCLCISRYIFAQADTPRGVPFVSSESYLFKYCVIRDKRFWSWCCFPKLE